MPNIINNAYHEAILTRDLVKLTELGARDGENQGDEINKTSWMNTPLLLAVKTGFFEAALLLLEQHSSVIDVNTKDGHELSALHWACLYKNDAVINRLVSMGADTSTDIYAFLGTQAEGIDLPTFIPLDIYKSQWPTRAPASDTFYSNPNDTSPKLLMPIPSYNPRFSSMKDKFIYNPQDKFIMPFHDMVFHLDAVCINLGLAKSTDFVKFGNPPEKSSDLQRYGLQSSKVFQENFKIGYQRLRDYLNAIPCSDEISNSLNSQDSSSSESMRFS